MSKNLQRCLKKAGYPASMWFFVVGACIVLLLFVAVTYNSFVRKQHLVKLSYSSIDINLLKRADLIPSLVSVVKGYAAHEKNVLESVTALRQQIQKSHEAQSSVAERLSLEEQIRPALGRLLALSEAYPDLKADSQFLQLQRSLTEVEEQLSASRRAYNASVLSLNTAVLSFPTNLIASIFSIQQAEYFETAEDKKMPVVLDFQDQLEEQGDGS